MGNVFKGFRNEGKQCSFYQVIKLLSITRFYKIMQFLKLDTCSSKKKKKKSPKLTINAKKYIYIYMFKKTPF